ncbi:MAG: gliding motility-associated C-terminal domain-containing protein [Crocinitomicaceae bacterium]|nr:gliding motility-associated C-terminal domain-containing protein [Crocinitomicaceae bacterium]MBK8927895.1 gliding motility-associated C-terminal domain-containing protein [Crocinitomicaceae bacterium]
MRLNDLFTGLTLISAPLFAQPANNSCSNADRLCPNVIVNGNTQGATTDAATDYNFCFTPSATIWYKFTTDADGGTVTIDFSNLVFNPDASMGQQIEAHIIEATTPCSIPTYTPLSACGNGAGDFSVTSAIALAANTTYYVQVNGANTGAGVTQSAECTFDITISGDGVEQTAPTASISAANTVLCFGDTEIVTATVSAALDTVAFNWYFNNALLVSSSTQNTYDAGTLLGDGYLKLIFETDAICTISDTTDSIYFEVTQISANAGPDKFISEGGQTTLDGSGDGTPVWAPGSSLNSTSVFTPVASPTTNTTYFLSVTSGTCTATDSVNVFVGEIINVFTAFTPNGDDVNDKWIIQNSGQFDNIEIWVYDRSGQEVFHTTNYSTQDKWWDGTLKNNGDPLPASTYFYVIDLKEGDYPLFKGSVTIIR